MNHRRPLVLAASIAAVASCLVPIALAGKGAPAEARNHGRRLHVTLSPGDSYVFGESVYATTNVPATSARSSR